MFRNAENTVTETLIQKLGGRQISVDTIDKNYMRNFPKEKLLKLNVSNVKEDKIEEGIRKVIEEIKQSGRLDFQFKKNNTYRKVYCEAKNNNLVCSYCHSNWSVGSYEIL